MRCSLFLLPCRRRRGLGSAHVTPRQRGRIVVSVEGKKCELMTWQFEIMKAAEATLPEQRIKAWFCEEGINNVATRKHLLYICLFLSNLNARQLQ